MKLKFAPNDIFEQILEYAVIPTFDLVITFPNGDVVTVRRRIAPYANQWALPGLRMMKPESIDDTLVRIAKSEVGLNIKPDEKQFLGQFVGRFRTEHHRQDISTGYAVPALLGNIKLNTAHFYSWRLITDATEIPTNMGNMYKFYLTRYFSQRNALTAIK